MEFSGKTFVAQKVESNPDVWEVVTGAWPIGEQACICEEPDSEGKAKVIANMLNEREINVSSE